MSEDQDREPVDEDVQAEEHADDLPDDLPNDLADGDLDEAPVSRPGNSVSTGHPAVDEVLRSLEGLDGRPVDEHVAAFEEAHDVLRRALSHAGDDPVRPAED